jgi:hypothetical protein
MKTELRSVQAPLKSRYREDPDSALVTLRADGRLDSDARLLLGGHRTGARGRGASPRKRR